MKSLGLYEMSYNYDIIIAHYGIKHLTELCLACLKSIRSYSSNYRLIFIDNASPEFDKILPELELHNHLLIRNTENLGFIKAVNQGLALVTAPYIVLLNNDTEVCENWLEKLSTPLTLGASISGPLCTSINSWQGQTYEADRWELLPKNHMLAFFCTMFRKEVFDVCGFLDEDFGVGFADDDWYCWKAQRENFRLALVRNLKIHHHHRSTFFELYGPSKAHEMQVKALELLRTKQKMALGMVS
jgi:GT2 family glycosyltransferase